MAVVEIILPDKSVKTFDHEPTALDDHGLAVPKRGPVTEDEAMAIVVESTLEWIIREVVGNAGAG